MGASRKYPHPTMDSAHLMEILARGEVGCDGIPGGGRGIRRKRNASEGGQTFSDAS